MINKFVNFFYDQRSLAKISIALSKGLAGMQSRSVNLTHPPTWEFSGFSQNGEDGIIQILKSHIRKSNKYFIEIGSSIGHENNSAWLAIVDRYKGLMIEGNKKFVLRTRRNIVNYSLGVMCENIFVKKNNVNRIKDISQFSDPDIFSLDIDGNDFYIAEALFNIGFRPKIFVVEFNSVFGDKASLTIEYNENFNIHKAHQSELYYGVSISGWKKFFSKKGYRFITVDSKGVNAFFIDPKHFNNRFLTNIKGLEFAENQYQFCKFQSGWKGQFKLIKNMPFIKI
jgi:hypothetical protein